MTDVTNAVLAEKLDNLAATVTTAITALTQQVKEHGTTLYGKENATGMVGRMQAVETRLNQITAAVVIIGVAVLGALLDYVINRLTP
jgi:mannose/fructose/N-acetylgalactosamine-specific phosphotransferase system component IID